MSSISLADLCSSPQGLPLLFKYFILMACEGVNRLFLFIFSSEIKNIYGT